MSYIMVDVETDGPCPGLFSMICFGAVVVEPELDRTFYGQLRPIAPMSNPKTLAISGFTREEILQFPEPSTTMWGFYDWVESLGIPKPHFVSDNNGFDWQFINYYLHLCCGRNPFGHSSTNLGSLYKGLVQDPFKNFKHLRDTKHDHHPAHDAMGNAEAMLKMRDMGLRFPLPRR